MTAQTESPVVTFQHGVNIAKEVAVPIGRAEHLVLIEGTDRPASTYDLRVFANASVTVETGHLSTLRRKVRSVEIQLERALIGEQVLEIPTAMLGQLLLLLEAAKAEAERLTDPDEES